MSNTEAGSEDDGMLLQQKCCAGNFQEYTSMSSLSIYPRRFLYVMTSKSLLETSSLSLAHVMSSIKNFCVSNNIMSINVVVNKSDKFVLRSRQVKVCVCKQSLRNYFRFTMKHSQSTFDIDLGHDNYPSLIIDNDFLGRLLSDISSGCHHLLCS